MESLVLLIIGGLFYLVLAKEKVKANIDDP